VPGSRRGWVGV
jgi:cation transport regulator